MIFARVLGVKRALDCRYFTCSATRVADYTHAIVGGGVVGLAIARQLATRVGTRTVILEKNPAIGLETSSRNSEVIHAGLYYGPESLKTRLCIRGKQLLYALCSTYSIPYARIGKWIVAHTEQQQEELVKLYKFSQTLPDVPTQFISQERALREEPFVHAPNGILESPSTGIVNSHALMQFLQGNFEENGGDLAICSLVTDIEALGERGSSGWDITILDQRSGKRSKFSSEIIINSAGLGACEVHNLILPQAQHRQQFYAKGNYFSCTRSRSLASRLIYPAPEPGLGGLGTHLTLDLSGGMRFGPDVEWVESVADLSVSLENLPHALKAIHKFLPALDCDTIVPAYAGIRPKLAQGAAAGAGPGFVDFYIQLESNWVGFVNLLGIESPGLTSSLAIAELVESFLYGSQANLGQGTVGHL